MKNSRRTWLHPALISCALAVSSVPTASGTPLITEVVANNDGSLVDEDGEASDWLEIHNPDGAPVDLTGSEDDIVACYPDDLPKFIGPKTRVVAISTHNPLGVTFAAGVYTSIFGESKQPINSFYAAKMFEIVKNSPYRKNFKVIVGGSGGWRSAHAAPSHG